MRSTTFVRGGLLFAALCILFQSVAFAAPTKLPTAFNPSRHVYVTPGCNVPVTGMEPELQRSAVPTFAVFTNQGDEAFTPDLASDLTPKLTQIWSAQQGWPKDRYLIIIAVQNKNDPNKFSTNIEIGPALRRLGITNAELNQVLASANPFLSVHPNEFTLKITNDVADLINQHGGGNQGGGGTTSGGGANLLLILAVIAGVAVLVGVIIVLVRRHQKEAARKGALRKLSEANEVKDEIVATKTPLEASGLSFKPFEPRLDEADRLAAQARGKLEADPEEAETLANQTVEKLRALLAALKHAIELEQVVTVFASEIENARRQVTETRAQTVNFNYPGENQGDAKLDAHLLLNEAGCNPDDFIAAAVRERDAISPALAQGDVDAADAHWRTGRRACSDAIGCIERTLAAKRRVEQEMAAVLGQCTVEDKLAAQQVRQAYFNQQFVHAAQLMDALKKLIADRVQARTVVARCAELKSVVGNRLNQNERYVTPGTDDKFARLGMELQSLEEAVGKPTGDWSSLRARAEQVESGLREVDQEITRARAAFDKAVNEVRGLRLKFDAAELPNPQFGRLTRPTREKLVALSNLVDRLEAQIRLSKQDWAAISTDAGGAGDQIDEVKQMLATDGRRWQDIVERKGLLDQLSNGALYTVAVSGREYNGGTALAIHDPDFTGAVSQARRHLEAAQDCWNGRSFDQQGRELGEYLQPQLLTLNQVGWWSVAQMLRDSDDPVAQNYAFLVIGFRDDVTWQVWRDKFIAKQRVDANGFFTPMDVQEWKRTGTGGADLTVSPDFKGYGGTDPWTPPTPTAPPATNS